jgi:hypothetical protein
MSNQDDISRAIAGIRSRLEMLPDGWPRDVATMLAHASRRDRGSIQFRLSGKHLIFSQVCQYFKK